MANKTIPQLTNGNPAQSGDLIPIDRGGANFSISAASVAALAGGGSSLAVSAVAAPATVNVTTEGTTDWLVTTGQSFSGGQPNVGGSSFLWKKTGSGFVIQRSFNSYYTNTSISPAGGSNSINGGVAFTASAGDAAYPVGAGFSNGPPPVSLAAYIQVSASPTAGGGYGYQFTVPAVSTSRTLKLYMTIQGIGAANQATVTAHMVDGSIADQNVIVTDTGTGGIGKAYAVTITYKAASYSPMIVSVEVSGVNIGAVAFLGMTIA